MITAVYIVSPDDDLGKIPQSARKTEYDGRTVFVMRQGAVVNTVVFADGAPLALKRDLEQGLDCTGQMSNLCARLEGLLRWVNVSSSDVHAFVHFGGQGPDDLEKCNKHLSGLPATENSFKCHAISFGNRYPQRLFKDRVFSPPDGDEFGRMLDDLQRHDCGNFEHLRAARILLENCQPDADGLYNCSDCRSGFEELSAIELDALERDADLRKLYGIDEFHWHDYVTKDEWMLIKDKLSKIGGAYG